MVAPVGQRASSPRRGSRGSAGRVAALGTIAKTVSTQRGGGSNAANSFCNRTRVPRRARRKTTPEDLSAARVRRFALQNTAARILPGERVCKCLRRPVPVAKSVDVQYVPETSSAHYAGLQLCSSVWHCPNCAALISEKRRDELARLIKKHTEAGYSVYMTTYTISHSKHHDLAALLSNFLGARRKMRQGRRGQALRRDFQVIGTVSVLEVTWSAENGWHPHVHELVFCGLPEMDMEGYERAARSAWEDAAASFGLEMNRHGFDLARTFGAVADYIAKFGREPATETPWGTEAEMVKGHLKQGRTSEHYTPFALLAAINDEGRSDLEPIFHEYGVNFKGRKQLTYSPGLKAMYAEEEKDDEELMQEHEHEAVTLLELEHEQWHVVVGNDIRGELLEEARSGQPGRVITYLEDFGVQLRVDQVKRFEGWYMLTPAGPGRVTLVTMCPILKRWRCGVQLDQPGEDGMTWRGFDLVDLKVIRDGKEVGIDSSS
jgi:hypothetical protein